jgi:hydrogenase maturation protein HypF
MLSRIQIKITGAVQGVGFRPFVYKLAISMNLKGWVLNSPQGVLIEAEGEKFKLEEFLLKLKREKPLISVIQSVNFEFISPVGYNSFEIKKSDVEGDPTAFVLPDIATCPDCLNDIFALNNRRYLYPFTNCTNCGPRFTIIKSLPYDRSRTSMKDFVMCDDCRAEYENPSDRRFHAQPNACHKCGPKVEFFDSQRNYLSDNLLAVLDAVAQIKSGKIVAVKGLGGFHLVCDAANDEAVNLLRYRKLREEKPFALMLPDINFIYNVCKVSSLDEQNLLSPQSPIVLLNKNENAENYISQFVAANNPYLGVMLPYTPLHHILMRELKTPIVATSGNKSDEPICIDNEEAFEKLSGIADYFLVHNRPILRYVDDSIVVVNLNNTIVYRRSRGYAPFPITINPTNVTNSTNLKNILSVGAHLKNTIAYSKNNEVYISQHIGDLDTPESYKTFKNTIDDLKQIYNINPAEIICDYHPDYLSTKFAEDTGLPITKVQHHIAHIFSCMAENNITESLLGVSWDGTGYGLDGTIWGGEFFLVRNKTISRIAHLRTFPLPGGEIAIKNINRTAIGMLYEIFGENIFNISDFEFLFTDELFDVRILKNILSGKINSPVTSSAGRLFDAVASILNLRQRVNFEGQAAMELEFLIGDVQTDESYKFELSNNGQNSSFIIDWEPVVHQILTEKSNKISLNLTSAKFHNGLTQAVLDIAERVGEKKIVLSGGCFQNRYLLQKTVKSLEEKDFKVYFQKNIPPNDGGISLGQIYCKLSGYEISGF